MLLHGGPAADHSAFKPLFSRRPRDAAAVRALTWATHAPCMALPGREPLLMVADCEAAVHDRRVDRLLLDGRLAAVIEMVPGADHLMVRKDDREEPFMGGATICMSKRP